LFCQRLCLRYRHFPGYWRPVTLERPLRSARPDDFGRYHSKYLDLSPFDGARGTATRNRRYYSRVVPSVAISRRLQGNCASLTPTMSAQTNDKTAEVV